MNRRDRFSILRAFFRAALAGTDPRRAVAKALAGSIAARALAGRRRIGVFAVGKAATAMFRGAWRTGREGLVVLPHGFDPPGRAPVPVIFASHPEPDATSVRAARAALEFFRRFDADDAIVCLVSGGASSLLCLPRPGVGLARKKSAIGRLVRSGAPIEEVNRLRTSLSAVKGGRLGRATAARIVTLVLSDVPGDRAAVVGSGPTVTRRAGDVTLVVGSNRDGLLAAARAARRDGWSPLISRKRVAGEAAGAGRQLARRAMRLPPGSALFAGGETTVTLSRRFGRGGRNLELAAAAALELEGARGVALLAAGSDGRDGSARAAGAIVDGRTAARARALGLDPAAALANHDTEPFFERAGGLVVTGATGTNVADWMFAVRTENGKRKTGNDA